MLTKIMETCNVKVKEVDSSMRDKLIVNLFDKSTCTTHHSEVKLSMDNESLIGKNKNKVPRFTPNKHRPKRMQDSSPNEFTRRPGLNKGPNKMNQSDVDQMKLKLSKFFPNNTSSNEEFRFSNPLEPNIENLRNVRTQSEIERCTQLLYQHIANDAQQQNDSRNLFSNVSDRYNQSHSNMNSSFQQFPSQNPHPPSLLNLRFQDPRSPPNKYNSKKK